jgi:AraC-like DNA-binding protein
MMVRNTLEKLKLPYIAVRLGEIELVETISPEQKELLRNELLKSGIELMDDKKVILIEQIKTTIIQLIHHSDEQLKTNLSDYLSEKLNYNYSYLANLFSESEGITIEHFVIARKIEKAKELIIYNELSLTEIAYKLHYSSVAHLSNQFKKITGLTPSRFKTLTQNRRRHRENL